MLVSHQARGDTIQPIPLAPLEVTALRIPLLQSAAPMAVAVLEESNLRQGRSGAFLEEALQGLPGVQVQNRYNPAVGERVAIRGFGARAQFGMRGIRVVVDGIPATLPDGQSTLDHLDIASLGRVEVVRGTSSALFGNAAGGVLAFHTRSPAAERLRLEAEQVLGSHGLSRAGATASGTVDRTGYFVTASVQRWDGYRINPSAEAEGKTYGQADRLGLNARVNRRLGGGELSLTLNLLDLDSENPGSLARSFLGDPDRPAHGVGPVSNVARRTGKEVRQDQLGLRWEGAMGGLDADVSLFGVRRSVLNPIPSHIIDLRRDGAGARAQVGRTESTGWGPLRLFAGFEAEFMFDDRVNHLNDAGEPGALDLDQRERVRGSGIYFQANVPLPGGAEGLAGVRYDRHDFRAWDRYPREAEDPSAAGERTMDAVSPSLGMNLPLREGLNLFASFGTVFETPSTTELANRPDGAGGFNPELDPQTGTSGELGIRGYLLGMAMLEMTVYRTNLENELIPFEVPGTPGRVFFRNAGSSRHTGAEATVTVASATGLVSGTATYTRTNARFRRFQVGDDDLGGNRVPGVAPERAQGIIRLNSRLWFGEVVGSYVGGVPVNDANTETAPSYFVMDVRMGVRERPIGNLMLAPWAAVTNVLDRYYVSSVAVNAFGNRFYEPGPPRSFQVGLRAVWGGEKRARAGGNRIQRAASPGDPE